MGRTGFEDARVLITGITGFVGPYLAKSLLDEGAKVYGLARRLSDGNLSRGLSDVGIEKEVKVLEGSLENLTSLLFALDKSEPEFIFHLAAQSFVERSFLDPLETFQTNATGTINLLEAIRIKDKLNSRLVFSGTSEEYGLVLYSEAQLQRLEESGRIVFPPPLKIPEVPIKESNPLRPISPYAVTKVLGENITLNYVRSYGLNGLVTRSFNHEGARRGGMFVTSVIAKQVMRLKYRESNSILLGNVNTFRDWSHIDDIVEGYKLASLKGTAGDVYNLGSERTNSVLTYLLWTLEEAGFHVRNLETLTGNKRIDDPAVSFDVNKFGVKMRISKVDQMLLDGQIEFDIKDKGIRLDLGGQTITVEFDPSRFRPADVPLLLCDATKAKEKLGFKPTHSIRDIIKDQLNYYAVPDRRR